MTYNKRNRTVLGLSLAASLIALGACGGGGDESGGAGAAEEPTSESSETAGTEESDGPDLEGIPDVVAEVNGEEVTKEEFVPIYEAQFQQAASQAQMTGQAPDEDAL
jgi:hypothetical protein